MKKLNSIFAVVALLYFFHNLTFAQTKIDEYGKMITDDEFGHLANVADELSKKPETKAYFLINKEKQMPLGKFLRHFYGVEDFSVGLGISKNLIVMNAGREKEKLWTEIWLVKEDEKPPRFETVSLEEKLFGKITSKTLFDRNCIDCDESPFINQFIFREGLDYLATALKANPTAKAVLKIARVEYLSKTIKERNKLTVQIVGRLRKNQIPRNRFSIQFTSGMEAFFYINPKS